MAWPTYRSDAEKQVQEWVKVHARHGLTRGGGLFGDEKYNCAKCQQTLIVSGPNGARKTEIIGNFAGQQEVDAKGLINMFEGETCTLCAGIDLEGGRCEACGRGSGNDFLLGPDWLCPKCQALGAPAMRTAAGDTAMYISCQKCGFERRITKSKDGFIVMDLPKPNGIPKVFGGTGVGPSAWKCPWCDSMDPPNLSRGAGGTLATCSTCGASEDNARAARALVPQGPRRPAAADAMTCTSCGEALFTAADYYRHEREHRDQPWGRPKPIVAQPEPRPDPRKRFIRD